MIDPLVIFTQPGSKIHVKQVRGIPCNSAFFLHSQWQEYLAWIKAGTSKVVSC